MHNTCSSKACWISYNMHYNIIFNIDIYSIFIVGSAIKYVARIYLNVTDTLILTRWYILMGSSSTLTTCRPHTKRAVTIFCPNCCAILWNEWKIIFFNFCDLYFLIYGRFCSQFLSVFNRSKMRTVLKRIFELLSFFFWRFLVFSYGRFIFILP